LQQRPKFKNPGTSLSPSADTDKGMLASRGRSPAHTTKQKRRLSLWTQFTNKQQSDATPVESDDEDDDAIQMATPLCCWCWLLVLVELVLFVGFGACVVVGGDVCVDDVVIDGCCCCARTTPTT
jgi:hypothetical protein